MTMVNINEEINARIKDVEKEVAKQYPSEDVTIDITGKTKSWNLACAKYI